MSTNYYLINKEDRDKLERLNKFILREMTNLQKTLIEFSDINELDTEEEIKDKLEECTSNLLNTLFNPEVIHICRTSNTLTWQITEHFKNIEEFILFYRKNQDKYNIEDEYEDVYTLDELFKKINNAEGKVRYEHWDFS